RKCNAKVIDTVALTLAISSGRCLLSPLLAVGKTSTVSSHITTHEKSTFVYAQSSPIASALCICDHAYVRSGRHGVRRGEIVGPVMGEIRQQKRVHQVQSKSRCIVSKQISHTWPFTRRGANGCS